MTCFIVLAVVLIASFLERRLPLAARLFPQAPTGASAIQKPTRSSISGKIVSEVERRVDRQQFVLQSHDPAFGRIWVTSRLYPRYRYGDVLKGTCLLRPPTRSEEFNEQNFLRLKNVFLVCRYPQWVRLAIGKGNPSLQALLLFKEKILALLNRSLPEPHASLLAGVLLGARRSMPKGFYDALIATGTIHLIAISGANVAIVLEAGRRFCAFLGWTRRASLAVLMMLLMLLVLLTGASSSVVRSAMMGALMTIAITFGRRGSALHLLLIAMTIMVLFHPLILRYDVGFQLSAAATFGLIAFTPWMERRCGRVPDRFALRQNLASTLAASLAVTPILLWTFGRISIGVILANVLVLPAIPWVMAAGTAALPLTALFPSLRVILFFPALVFLQWLILAIEAVNALPFLSWG